MKKIVALTLFVSVLINIAVITFYIRHILVHPVTTDSADTRSLPFLSKRIFLEDQNDMIINFVELRKQLLTYMKQGPQTFGIYFEYLPSGVSIGVNEKQSYVLASLLKVPLAMAIYKEVESGKLTLDTPLTIRPTDVDKYFGDLWKKGAGTKITVSDALRLMLTESDNTAKNVLFYVLPAGAMEEVFDYLDIPKQLAENENTPVVTPKNYSSILRSLYLSSYLNKTYSNEILRLLSESHFDDKLTSGVPKYITVAHKIGVHETKDANTRIYTDCGIIYIPKRPYVLCLMIQSTESEAQMRMRDVSKMIYTYVSEINDKHTE